MLKHGATMMVVPLAAALVVAFLGLTGVWAGRPWLFASLGPTAALQAAAPDLPMSRPWNVAVSHLIGLAVGILAVHVTGAFRTPAFSGQHALALSRVWAAAFAIALSMGLELAAGATHAPAASTTLLFALGIFPPSWNSAQTVLCGVALVTGSGEAVRQLRRRMKREVGYDDAA
jgi:hypothetical protein